MRQGDARFMSTSSLRKELTKINKARKGADSHQNGLTRLVLEDMAGKERIIRNEILNRKKIGG